MNGRMFPMSGQHRSAAFDLIRTLIGHSGAISTGDPGASGVADDQRPGLSRLVLVAQDECPIGRSQASRAQAEHLPVGANHRVRSDLVSHQQGLEWIASLGVLHAVVGKHNPTG